MSTSTTLWITQEINRCFMYKKDQVDQDQDFWFWSLKVIVNIPFSHSQYYLLSGNNALNVSYKTGRDFLCALDIIVKVLNTNFVTAVSRMLEHYTRNSSATEVSQSPPNVDNSRLKRKAIEFRYCLVLYYFSIYVHFNSFLNFFGNLKSECLGSSIF